MRFRDLYQLGEHDAEILTQEKAVSDFFEQVVSITPEVPPTLISHWITGDLFSLMNQTNEQIGSIKFRPIEFSRLIKLISDGVINPSSAKATLVEMFRTGNSPDEIVTHHGLTQISDEQELGKLVDQVISAHSDQVKEYLKGKTAISQWLFGQVMHLAGGRGNPTIIRVILGNKLNQMEKK